MAIKLLTLDLDNTLWETDPVIVKAEQASYNTLIEQAPGVADLYSLEGLREYKNQLAECYPSLVHQISRLRFETLRRVALQAGIEHDKAEAIAEKAFAVFMQERSNLTLFDGVLDALQTLAEELPLIALTNGNANLKAVGIDHLFTAHFSAEDVGAAKPEANLFHAALQHQQVEPHECLHIGDHPHQDIDAARQLGFHTLWVNALELQWPDDLDSPRHSIQHLSELVEAIADIKSVAQG